MLRRPATLSDHAYCPGVRENQRGPAPTVASPSIDVKTTRCFDEQVPRKRPYINPAWCAEVVAKPLRREEQSDGGVRWWGSVAVSGERTPRILRVVTLADGETVHNAFFDRRYKEE